MCYLIQNGADRFSFIFFRGFGTGAMHVLCGIIVGAGLAYTWQRTWLKIAGTCGLLGAAITLHAIYNLLITYGGAARYIAYSCRCYWWRRESCLHFVWYEKNNRISDSWELLLGGSLICKFCILGESFPEFCTYIGERTFHPRLQQTGEEASTDMYDTTRRVELVKRQIRKIPDEGRNAASAD